MIITTSFQNISIAPKETPHLFVATPKHPSPGPLPTTSPLAVSMVRLENECGEGLPAAASVTSPSVLGTVTDTEEAGSGCLEGLGQWEGPLCGE